jgi:hypothetical protein
VCIDEDKDFPETNEANNCLATPTAVWVWI